MLENTGDRSTFSVGDVVRHPTRGIGRVIQMISAPDPKIVVQQDDSVWPPMNVSLAVTALTKLPPDGLAAQIIKDKDAIKALWRSSPLRLVALALLDLNGAARAGEIRDRLQGTQLFPTKWETWWKKVQPALKRSPHIKVRHDGTYELLAKPEQVPLLPLPRVSKKKEVSVSPAQLLELVRKIEGRDVKLEDIEGAKTKHQIARELVKLSRKEPKVGETLIAILHGPARSASILLDELVGKGDIANIDRTLEAFLDHIVDLAHKVDDTSSSYAVAEHITVKLDMFAQALSKAFFRSDIAEMKSIPATADKMLSLALELGRAETRRSPLG